MRAHVRLPHICRILVVVALVGLVGALASCRHSAGLCAGPDGILSIEERLSHAGHVRWFTNDRFLDGRRIYVYLPSVYDPRVRRYPVLYMMDGQILFECCTSDSGAWGVERVCEELIRAGTIEPVIIVGIGSGAQRYREYTPALGYATSEQYGGGDEFLRAIRDVLKPDIDRRYATLADSLHTYIAGASLGGLISVYAAYAYRGTFSRAGSLSGSFWWGGFLQYAATRGDAQRGSPTSIWTAAPGTTIFGSRRPCIASRSTKVSRRASISTTSNRSVTITETASFGSGYPSC